MGNDATVVLKGDTTQLVGEVNKVGNALTGAGNQAGDVFGKAIGKLARGVVIAKAIGDTLKAVSAELDKINADRQNIAGSGISSRVNMQKNANRLGLGGSGVGSILSASGATTEEQRGAFLASLDENNGADANRQALNLFNTGLFSEKELNAAIQDGSLKDLAKQQAKRRSDLGPDFARLVEKEDQTRSINNEKFEATRSTDLKVSESKRLREMSRLENPGFAAASEGLATGLGKVPIVGGILESTARTADDIGFKILAAMQGTQAATEKMAGDSKKLNIDSSVKDNQ